MEMLSQLPMEFSTEEKVKMLELLNQNTGFFMQWTQADIAALAEISRFYSFRK